MSRQVLIVFLALTVCSMASRADASEEKDSEDSDDNSQQLVDSDDSINNLDGVSSEEDQAADLAIGPPTKAMDEEGLLKEKRKTKDGLVRERGLPGMWLMFLGEGSVANDAKKKISQKTKKTSDTYYQQGLWVKWPDSIFQDGTKNKTKRIPTPSRDAKTNGAMKIVSLEDDNDVVPMDRLHVDHSKFPWGGVKYEVGVNKYEVKWIVQVPPDQYRRPHHPWPEFAGPKVPREVEGEISHVGPGEELEAKVALRWLYTPPKPQGGADSSRERPSSSRSQGSVKSVGKNKDGTQK